VSAALAVALAAHEFRDWVAQRFGQRALPPFAIGIGLHAGAVTIARLGSGAQLQTTPGGDTVDTAARLEDGSKELGWTVVASAAVLHAAGSGVQTGAMSSLEVRGRHEFVDVAQIVGLQPGPEDDHPGIAVVIERAAAIEEALRINSELTARAVKGALRSTLSAVTEHRFRAGDAPLRLKDYLLTRRLGAGAMSEVYLAEREEDGQPAVLKVLRARGAHASEQSARFIQEYALLSRIADPHVTGIYDQGFSDDLAYIAMEYFERGDLRQELRAGMSRERVLEVLQQLARALEVIHGHGIVHRDLKPENVMVRADGSVALADFGVARSMLQQDLAQGADAVGTPFYLSPEQAAGGPVTPASDLYSLGVMLYEMLTGQRPYQAETLQLLLARHTSAPVPQLPPEFAGLQPVLDRLMAKQPQDRYPSAGALLADLRGQAWPRTPAGPAAG
jgi:tRNA A-37 threonylcarbamoyl transferase component Bud32